jgi:hypothetical protein
MRWLAAFFLALAIPAPVVANDLTVAVKREGDRWTADFAFSQRQPAFFFNRSAITRVGQKPWRPQSWRVLTPGVQLVRQGYYDVLASTNGGPLPRSVRVAFTPFTADLLAEYDPALVFTDGSVALFTQQFVGNPIESARAAARLPIDLNGVPLRAIRIRLSFADRAGPVMIGGERRRMAVLQDRDGAGTYVLFGPITMLSGPAFASVVDPQLPAWLTASLSEFTPRLLTHYTAELGQRPGPKPTLLASWGGATRGLASMGGSTLSGLITMAFEGEGVVNPDSKIRHSARWFIAHEAAHFWLGQAIAYEYSRDAWIMEGGADLLAIRAVDKLDPSFDERGEMQREIDDCAALTKGQSLATAEIRNEYRAYYACGAVLSLVAEAATRQPFERFVRELIAQNRDGIVSKGEWFAAVERKAPNPGLRRDMETLIDRGSDRPGQLIASMLRTVGIPFRDGRDGVPQL